MTARQRSALWIGLAAPYGLLVWRFAFVCDDAWISFRFARHLASGEGLRYNPGLPAVEGYSNFLWVLVAALVEAAGGAVSVWMPALSAACGLVLLLQVFERLRGRVGLGPPAAFLVALTLALFPPFALWSTGGLATVPFALALYALFDEWVARASPPRVWLSAGAALCVALLRVEGVLWVGVVAALAVFAWTQPRPREDLAPARRALLRAGLLFLLAFGVYTAWRVATFGDWLPNTARAKVPLSPALLLRGYDYVAAYALTFLTPLLLVPATLSALHRRREAGGGVAVATAAMAWAFPAYSVLTGGDFMAMGRFMVAGLPFATLLLGGWLATWQTRSGRRAACVLAGAACVVGLLPAWNLHLVPEGMRERHRFRLASPVYRTEFEQWEQMRENALDWTELGRALARYAERELGPRSSLVATAIGAVGYHSGLVIYDQAGLVSREVAMRTVQPHAPRSPGHDRQVGAWYFLDRNPTLLRATWIEGETSEGFVSSVREAVRPLRRVRRDLQAWTRYAPEVVLLEPGRGFVVWRRIPRGVHWRAAWRDFEERLAALGEAPWRDTAPDAGRGRGAGPTGRPPA